MVLNPHHGANYAVDLAGAYRNLGRYEEAIASLEDALARNPAWIPAYFELAMTYCVAWGMHDPDPLSLDRASEAVQKLFDIDDSSFYGYFAMSLISLYQKQYEKALAKVAELIDFNPENADSYALMAVIYNSVGRPAKAMEMIEKAMQINPAAPAWYLNTLGDALSDRSTEALAIYERVLERNPSHADAFNAHLSLAMLYVELGQEENARAQAKEILKLVPNFSVKLWGQRNPYIDQAQIKRNMVSLRKAGLR